jgi:hypothetical protein
LEAEVFDAVWANFSGSFSSAALNLAVAQHIEIGVQKDYPKTQQQLVTSNCIGWFAPVSGLFEYVPG